MTPLRQRMLEDMPVRNLSPPTPRASIENVARFARHFGRSPAELGPEEIRTYQVYLIRERTLAPSSLEIAVCALRFLYKVTLKKPWSSDDQIPAPKQPRRLPVVLSPELFPGDPPDHPIGRGAVRHECRPARRRSRMPKPITPHSLRHACAVHLLDAGTDGRTMQRRLGHRRLEPPARYLRIATTKVGATTSPLDRLPRPVASSATPPTAPTC